MIKKIRIDFSKLLIFIFIFFSFLFLLSYFYLFKEKEEYKITRYNVIENLSEKIENNYMSIIPTKIEEYTINASNNYKYFFITHFSNPYEVEKSIEEYIERINPAIKKIENFKILNYDAVLIELEIGEKIYHVLLIKNKNRLFSATIDNIDSDKKIVEWFIKNYFK